MARGVKQSDRSWTPAPKREAWREGCFALEVILVLKKSRAKSRSYARSRARNQQSWSYARSRAQSFLVIRLLPRALRSRRFLLADSPPTPPQGGKSVVVAIAGVSQRIPRTAWILTYTKADGNVWPNVNLALTTVMPGDTLTWKLYKIGEQPTPRPATPQEDVGAPSTMEDEPEL